MQAVQRGTSNQASISAPHAAAFSPKARKDSNGSSTTSPITQAAKVLATRISNPNALVDEYRSILDDDETIPHTSSDALLECNRSRNRYSNVLPFDFNRVRLASAPDYVNASLVSYTDPTGFSSSYIATQGPLPSTAEDFWRMIYEKRVPAIVMLTNLTERGTVKCHSYFPTRTSTRAVCPNVGLEVSCLSVAAAPNDVIVRAMSISPVAKTGPTHELLHFHYTSWPDHGAPMGVGGIRTISQALDSLRLSMPSKPAVGGSGSGLGPVAVHCSAGIGRTGTFCAIDILRQRAAAIQARTSSSGGGGGGASSADVALLTDIPGVVRSLREQRMGMVQTSEQYVFCYEAMAEELGQSGCSSQ